LDRSSGIFELDIKSEEKNDFRVLGRSACTRDFCT